jgi:hypothetical protein
MTSCGWGEGGRTQVEDVERLLEAVRGEEGLEEVLEQHGRDLVVRLLEERALLVERHLQEGLQIAVSQDILPARQRDGSLVVNGWLPVGRGCGCGGYT